MKITMVSLAQNYLPKNIVCAFQKECPGKFDAFNPKDMTDKAFGEFANKAEEDGYKIYKLIRL